MKMQYMMIATFVILVGSSLSYFAFADPPTVNIPPTNAFAHIKTQNGTSDASFFDATTTFKPLKGLHIWKGTNGIVYFNATASNGTSIVALTCALNSQLHSVASSGIFTCAANNVTGSATLDTMQNVGSGQGSIYKGNNTNMNFQFKTLSGSNGTKIENNTSVIFIDGQNFVNVTKYQIISGIKNFTTGVNIGDMHFKYDPVNAKLVIQNDNKPNNVFASVLQLKPVNGSGVKGFTRMEFDKDTGGNSGSNLIIGTNFANNSEIKWTDVNGNPLNITTMTSAMTISDVASKIDFLSPSGFRGELSDVLFPLNGNDAQIMSGLGKYALSPFSLCVAGDAYVFKGSNTTFTCQLINNGTVSSIQNIGHGGKGVLASITSNVLKGKNMTSLSNGNLTIASNNTDVNYNLGSNAVITGGSAQTITKQMTFNNGTVFVSPSTSSLISTFKNSSGVSVATITPQGVWTGSINNPIGADFTIAINGTGFFVEFNGKTNQILKTSTTTTDASAVIQDALNRVNSTGASGKGGWIDVDCGTYPVKKELEIPRNGNMTLTGHGLGCTIFETNQTGNNNFAGFHGNIHSLKGNSFFNHFAHFHVVGNQGTGATNDTGFFFNSTGFGITDTTFDDLMIERFKGSDIWLNAGNTWNVLLTNSIIEHGSLAGLIINASTAVTGTDFRAINNKFIFNEGFAINSTGSIDSFIGNWFYKNNLDAIWFGQDPAGNGAAASGNILQANRFEDNGLGTTNTYDDIELIGSANNINGNYFYGTENGLNKIKYNIEEDSFTTTNNFVGNNFANNNIGTATVSIGTTSVTHINFGENVGYISKMFNYTTPNNQTGTASTSLVIYGGYATITPRSSGNVTVLVTGYAQSSILLDGCRIAIQQSTSNLGANGAAATMANEVGRPIKLVSATALQQIPFQQTYLATLLKPFNKYFFDLDFSAITGGTCTIFNPSWTIQEK